jgi:hypothetical protein
MRRRLRNNSETNSPQPPNARVSKRNRLNLQVGSSALKTSLSAAQKRPNRVRARRDKKPEARMMGNRQRKPSET